MKFLGSWRAGVCVAPATVLVTVALVASVGAAPTVSPVRVAQSGHAEGLDLFERQVRPLLTAECESCHGPRLQQGGLRLDERAAAIKGGSRGPALRPGDPDRSLLLRAMRHQGLKMPPANRLPESRVAAVEQWIRLGAPWPARTTGVVLGDQSRIFREARTHWAYQPVRRPAAPAVKDPAWIRTPVDSFVLARLEAQGLTPSPAADRRTLLRRVTYDLTGLPPKAEEVAAFLADSSPNAYAQVVDRLLASPQYGERWGRHWLDVARYADTKDGVLMYGDSRIRPYAYTYRDYVIRAFNEDTPYNQFVQEQLAADQMQPAVAPWRLAAMGFLTLGRQFDNNNHDVIDDRIDTVGRGLLGLTLACARCHDHKYDAVPIADYYSLYGVFASSDLPSELPQIEQPAPSPQLTEFAAKYAAQSKQLDDLVTNQHAQLTETARVRVTDYLVHVATRPVDPLETAIFFLSLSPDELRPQIVARWRRLIEQRARPEDPVFGLWGELMALPEDKFAQLAPPILARLGERRAGTGSGQVNSLVRRALVEAKPDGRAAVARAYGELIKATYLESKAPGASGASPEKQQLLDLVVGRDGPGFIHIGQIYYYLNRGEKDAYGGMRNNLDILAVQHPAAPARAMVLNDLPDLYEPRIFLRGSPAQPGPAVPRRFLQVLQGDRRRPFTTGSGRLDLARAITAPDNPLTARVLVNRVWMHHFGEPLVASPSDFGSRSSRPTHPALLDWLAASFVAPRHGQPSNHDQGMGWSLKQLHRVILLSNAYRQASADRPACRKADPENQLLWRAHRRRLDLEQMRDTLLAVSGGLDLTTGGRPIREAVDPATRRRTIYCLVDRQSLPEVFRAFNFAQPDQSVERRPNTMVPQQALFGLNSPFVLAQAKALAARQELTGAGTDEAKVAALYRLLLARSPKATELADGLEFVRQAQACAGQPGHSTLAPWEQYAQVLLLTNEMMFLD